MIQLVALGQFHPLLAVIRLWSPMRVCRFRPANGRARRDGARQRWFRVWRPGQRGQTNLCAGAGRWRCAASRASCRLAGFGLRCAAVPVSPGTPTGRAEMAFAGSGHRPVSGAREAADAPCGRQHLTTASSSPVGSSRRGSARRDAARLVRPQISSRSNTASSAKIPRAGRWPASSRGPFLRHPGQFQPEFASGPGRLCARIPCGEDCARDGPTSTSQACHRTAGERARRVRSAPASRSSASRRPHGGRSRRLPVLVTWTVETPPGCGRYWKAREPGMCPLWAPGSPRGQANRRAPDQWHSLREILAFA